MGAWNRPRGEVLEGWHVDLELPVVHAALLNTSQPAWSHPSATAYIPHIDVPVRNARPVEPRLSRDGECGSTSFDRSRKS
jgi:hypothetical protein